MRKIIAMVMMLTFAGIFIPACLYAGDSTPTIPTRESIIELLEISNVYKISLQGMRQVLEALKININENLPNNKKIPDEVWGNLVYELESELDKESLYDIWIPIYSKYLTSDDIKGAIIFYKSEAGKNVIRALPNISRDCIQASQEWSNKAMYRIIPLMEKRLKEMGYSKEPIG